MMDAKTVSMRAGAKVDQAARHRRLSPIKTVLKIMAVQAAILLVGVAAIEFALRVFLPLPVHGGVYIDRNGRSVHVALNEFVLRPNLDISHKASEFSARIRTTDLGYRWIDNASLTPDYLFLGDSFTFGHGVSDEETFADLFCLRHQFRCQNLGRSGTGTFAQTKILRYAIEHYGVRPARVILVMLAGCWLDAAGNDLGDNMRELAARSDGSTADDTKIAALAQPASESVDDFATLPLHAANPIRMLQRWFGDLEIVKRPMLALSRQVKGALYKCSDDRQIDTAVTVTRVALTELRQLASEYRFKVTVVVVHPYQELGGPFARTEQAVRRATPTAFDLILTGADFRKDQFYPYDGHLNVAGHRNMAAILDRDLLAEDRN
jgi:hypothetical protein